MSGVSNQQQQQEEDNKPNDQSAYINLKVKGQDGNEVFFRIKRSNQLKKLMNAYCDRQSVEVNSIEFLFDGRRLRAEQTLDEVGIEDGDEIDAKKVIDVMEEVNAANLTLCIDTNPMSAGEKKKQKKKRAVRYTGVQDRPPILSSEGEEEEDEVDFIESNPPAFLEFYPPARQPKRKAPSKAETSRMSSGKPAHLTRRLLALRDSSISAATHFGHPLIDPSPIRPSVASVQPSTTAGPSQTWPTLVDPNSILAWLHSLLEKSTESGKPPTPKQTDISEAKEYLLGVLAMNLSDACKESDRIKSSTYILLSSSKLTPEFSVDLQAFVSSFDNLYVGYEQACKEIDVGKKVLQHCAEMKPKAQVHLKNMEAFESISQKSAKTISDISYRIQKLENELCDLKNEMQQVEREKAKASEGLRNTARIVDELSHSLGIHGVEPKKIKIQIKLASERAASANSDWAKAVDSLKLSLNASLPVDSSAVGSSSSQTHVTGGIAESQSNPLATSDPPTSGPAASQS